MADRYLNFQALAAVEKSDVDYRIRFENRGTPIVVLAPHGGWIEPGTTEIAEAIAQDDFSFYSFEGLRRGRLHRDLHITSIRFDEPQALKLIGGAEMALAIHGRANGGGSAVWLGGRGIALRDSIASLLKAAGFDVALAEQELAGCDSRNICNRGTNGTGVQLELPRMLRDNLINDHARLLHFAGVIREAIACAKAR